MLPTPSKMYERSMFKQMSSFLKKYFRNHSVVFKKALVRNNVFEQYWKSRKIRFIKGRFLVVFGDFDCLAHELLIVRINAIRFYITCFEINP